MTIDEIKEKFTPDQEAQNATWVHGCKLDQISLVEKIIENSENSEICVTKIGDRHFQNFGIFVKGHVTLMSKIDIGSKYDPTTGKRSVVFDPAILQKVVVSKYADLVNPDGPRFYTESWVIPQEIVGVWVYDYVLRRPEYKKLVNKFKESKYQFTVIKSGLI